MTRLQIRNKARTLIDELGGEGAWTNEELNHLIDLAYKKAASFFLALDGSLYATPAVFTLEPTVEYYSLPADFLYIRWILDEDGNPITPLPNPALKGGYTDLGRVGVYYFRKDKIGFSAIPTAAQTLSYEYAHSPADLATDDSVPDVPAFLGHELIAAEVAAKALDMDEEVSPIVVEEIKELKKQIQATYYRRNRDFSPQVPGDPALDDLDD